MRRTSSTNFFIMKHFTYIKNSYFSCRKTILELANIDSEKYMQRQIESPAKHVITMNWFKTISSCTKQNKIDLNKWHDSEIAYFLILALLIVNLFQPLVTGNENCSGKYRFLKFKYSQMITWTQAKSLKQHLC